MPLGILTGLLRGYRKKRASSLRILTNKKSPVGYYKGNRCKNLGFHTRKRGYVLERHKIPLYIVPDLTDFKLKPYVAYNVHGNAARDILKKAEAEAERNKNTE